MKPGMTLGAINLKCLYHRTMTPLWRRICRT
jgi:hypothetical protein